MFKYLVLASALFLTACGGGGGSSQSSTTPVTPVTQNCYVDYTATYPNSYLGAHAIPTANGVLPNSWQKSIDLKDYSPYWVYYNDQTTGANKIHNCTEDQYAELMYTQALDKLKQDGVTFTWFTNYGYWDSAYATNLTISKYAIPEYMVQWFVQQAKQRNIDVYYSFQIQPTDSNGNVVSPINGKVDQATLTKIMNGWDTQVIEMAKFSQSVGMKGMMIDWSAYTINNLNDPVLHEIYANSLSSTIDHVRQNFSGTLVYGQEGRPWSDPRIIDKIDVILFSFMGGGFSASDNANLSPEIVQSYMTKQLNDFYSAYHCLGASTGSINCGPNGPSTKQVPIMFNAGVQSTNTYWLNGWEEDGFCNSSTANASIGTGTSVLTAGATTSSCVELTYVTDFSAQAIGDEGILRTVFQQTLFPVFGVDLGGYWLSDTIVPNYEGFPNISASVRGKPAEAIIKHWFTGS